MREIFICLLLSMACVAQSLPDAPSYVQPPQKSGWTRWDGLQSRTNSQVLHDKKFQWFSVGLVAATVWSVETTHAGVARHACVEGNSNFSERPSRGELYLHQGLATAGIVGMGFLIEKMLPADRSEWTKADKVAEWIYPAMASYGIQYHARDAVKWYRECW